jgi:hypothetical protein
MAVVLLDHREREVDSSRDSGRRIDRAVLEVDGLGLNVYLGMGACKLIGKTPVRNGPLSVEEACFRQYERAYDLITNSPFPDSE